MATSKVEAAIEEIVTKALGAGVDLESLESTLRGALDKVELAQAAALQSTYAAAPTGAPKKGGGVPREADPFDKDMSLDMDQFKQLAREREGDGVSDEHLEKIFKAFDADGSGHVSAHEYLRYSLAAALAATQLRAIDLFKQWDDDGNGTISEKEFVQAVKVLGYAVPSSVSAKLYRELDVDNSGHLEYKELGLVLNKRAGASNTKQELLRCTPRGQDAGTPGGAL